MKLLFYVLFLINTFSWSQESKFTGIVKDAETFKPLPYVSIVFEDNSSKFKNGSITNATGEFSVSKTNANVSFSHINYETLHITLNDSTTEIFLVPKTYILQELVIANISAKDYLKNLVKESKKKIDKNTNFKSYCREIVKVNDKYTKFSDALADYYVKKGNGSSHLILKQHRAFRNTSTDTNNTKKSNMTELMEQNYNSVYAIKDYVKNAYNFKAVERVLKNEDYQYEWWTKTEADGLEYEQINIIPDKKSDKVLFEGYVIIDPKTKNILEFKLSFSESHKQNSKFMSIMIMKVKTEDFIVWSKFRNIDNQYVLVYNKVNIEMILFMKNQMNDRFSFAYDIFIYDFENNVEVPKNGYNKRSLFEAGTNFTDEYWKGYNLFPLSKEEEGFIDSVTK